MNIYEIYIVLYEILLDNTIVWVYIILIGRYIVQWRLYHEFGNGFDGTGKRF